MFPNRQKRLNRPVDVKLVAFRSFTSAEDVDEFFGELEIGAFETHVFAWGPVEDETEVYVHYVALRVYHDVSVVSVFYLKNVRNNRVSCQGTDKVQLSYFELNTLFTSELFSEVSK